MVPLQPRGSKPPFFFMAGQTHFGDRLGPDQPVYRVVYQDLDREQPLTRIEDMAAYAIENVRSVQPRGPYYLGGHAYGGIVALEMARQLQQHGEQVAALILCESWTPDSKSPVPGISPIYRILQKINYRGRRAMRKGARQKLALRFESLRESLKERLSRRRSDAETLNRKPDSDALFEAIDRYVLPVYSGDITLIRCSERLPWEQYDPLYGWRNVVTGDIDVYEIPGGHVEIYREPSVHMLVETLSNVLDKSQVAATRQRRALDDPRTPAVPIADKLPGGEEAAMS